MKPASTLGITLRITALTTLLALLLIAPPAAAQNVGELLIGDGFSNNALRPPNGKLDKTAVESGRVVWDAERGIGLGIDKVTNISPSGTHVATVPFDFDDHPSFPEFRIEAMINPIGSEFVGLGFSKSARGPFWNHGEVWLRLYDSGIVEVFADGTNFMLYQSPEAEPAFIQGENHVKLMYNRGSNRVRGWLNGVELNLSDPDLDVFDFHPRITRGGFHAHGKAAGWADEGELEVDAFTITGSSKMFVTSQPQPWTAIEGTEAFFFGAASEGQPPYTFQWQYKANEQALWFDLADGGLISGVTTDTLFLSDITAIDHMGEYRLVIMSAPPYDYSVTTDPAMLTVQPAEVADFFDTDTVSRPDGTALNGAMPTIGASPWTATDGPVNNADYLTNTETWAMQVGGLPFVFDENIFPGSEYRFAIVEALIEPNDSIDSWIGVGFSDSATGGYWSNGQVWAFLRGDGRLHVKADGLEGSLYEDSVTNAAHQSGPNHVKIQYDRIFNSVRVWLNQTEINLTVSDLRDLTTFPVEEFVPDIVFVGFHAQCTGGHIVPDGFYIDDFAAGYDAEIQALAIAIPPQDMIVQRSYPATFTVTPSGGIEPYEYQWKFRPGQIGNWEDISYWDLPNVSGELTDTLTITVAETAHDGFYKVVIKDSDIEPVTMNSISAELIVANPTAGCTISDPPIADFSTDVGEWTAEDMNSWTATGTSGEFVAGAAYVGTHDDRGRISNPNAVSPKGYNTIKIEFSWLDQVTDMRLDWSQDPADSISFSVGPENLAVEIDLSREPSWAECEDIAGFCTRELVLHFETGLAMGHIDWIDTVAGPHLKFGGPPALFLGSYEAQTFGAGAEMILHQLIQNIGCDLGSFDAPAERQITYSLCKTNEPYTCFEAFDYCNEGHFTLGGSIPESEFRDYQAGCMVTLPPADSPEDDNLVNWTLTGTFDNDPTKEPATFSFDLAIAGTANLKISRYMPLIEAKSLVDSVYQPRAWIGGAEEFIIEATVQSEFYPSSNVVCEIWARGHDPVTLGGEWSRLGSENIPYISGPGAERVTFGDLNVVGLIPGGKTWAFMDIKLVLDPENTIDEGEGELDNEFEVYDWIPISVVNLGAAVGALVFEDEMAGPVLPETNDLDVNYSSGGETRLNVWPIQPEGSSGAPQPYLHWPAFEMGESKEIGGVIMRYRRDQWVYPSLINAGVVSGAEPAVDPYHKLIKYEYNSDDNPIVPKMTFQWQTVAWKKGDIPPFNVLDDLHLFVDLKGEVNATAQSLYLAVDGSTLNNNYRYTGTMIDYIGVWSGEPPPTIPLDIAPMMMVEKKSNETESNGEWRELPGHVMAGSVHEIGVRIYSSDSSPVDPNLLSVTRIDDPDPPGNPDPVITLNISGYEDLGDGTFIYFLYEDQPGMSWRPQETGDYTFVATVHGDADDSDYGWNNTLTTDVRVDNNCPVPFLTLPY